MKQQEIIPHLFRTEYSKITAVLCKYFGSDRIEMAEDIASETFLTAAQTWALKGVPTNPVAWLYRVAQNKAKNQLKRNNLFEKKIAPDLINESSAPEESPIDLSPQNIQDSQLQMMFTICHPSISVESQIGLSLRILCGFGIEEIADAFLTQKETITKRLMRAKQKLREGRIKIELPAPHEIDERLAAVLTTIYLLFNEGYYSISSNQPVRRDLCLEAMRLSYLLLENPSTNRPQVHALLSLMCFHTSRFEARTDKHGELILYDEQDSTLWNQELINKGQYFLNCAATGNKISRYHLEAAIAYWNTRQADTIEKWENILQLYNHLLQLEYSPVIALNRTYALSKAKGKAVAIIEAEKLQLTENHFYFALLGELYTGVDQDKARDHYKKALSLAKSQADKATIQRKLDQSAS